MIRQSKPRSVLPGIIAGAAIALLSAPPPAAAEVLRLEPASTTIQFTLGSTMHEVEGVFKLTGGEITFDRTTGEASGRIIVSALTGDTANEKRDKKMHEKVLESAAFPEIVFTAHRIDGDLQPQGESEVTLSGTMELRGTVHEFTIPASVRMEDDRLSGSAQFIIPFIEWGLEDPSVFIFRVKKEVQVTLDLAGTVFPAAAVAATGATPDHPAPAATSR
jgi:polyisoprenoid-binding protein YceI